MLQKPRRQAPLCALDAGHHPAALRRRDQKLCLLGDADLIEGIFHFAQAGGVNRHPAEIEKEIIALVREKIGPVAAFKLAITVTRLPKTRSGKILRGTMKKIADRDAWSMPATIDDPAILDEITAALKERGLAG